VDRDPLEDRLEDPAQRVVDQAVADVGGRYRARLRVGDRERAIPAGPPRAVEQLTLDPQRLALQVEEEPRRAPAQALAAGCPPPGFAQRAKARDPLEQVPGPLHRDRLAARGSAGCIRRANAVRRGRPRRG